MRRRGGSSSLKKRRNGGSSSQERSLQERQYVALAPGRDAVLKYQERQYRRQQHEQLRQYTGHTEVIQQQQRKGGSKQRGDVNLSGNRMRLGNRIESARSWVNGRRPDYY